MVADLSLHTTCNTLATVPVFAVPMAEMEEFTAIAEVWRTEMLYTLRVLERLHELIPNVGKMAALAEVANLHRHALRGLSEVSLDRKYKAYLAGGWRSLIKGYKAQSKQPAEFAQEVRRRCELNHRSQTEALEQLREAWTRGEVVPGWGTWMELYLVRFPGAPLPKAWPRGFYPQGWSPRNLLRYGPSKGTRSLLQRGVAASKKHFPCVKRDPSQLRPLELITFDDFELDCYCIFPPSAGHKGQIGRMAGLLAKDVGTRKNLVWGLGQRLEREEKQADGTVKTIRTGIARIDVQLLLYSLFEKYGLPDYPVTILCENAAASISPEMQLCIETLFEGRVKIERTGLIDNKTLTNGFAQGGGKPWEKGWIESTFNQLWNMLGSMKGYKGSNERLNGPAELEKKLQYTRMLIGVGERSLNLPPEAVARLRLPFSSPDEAVAAFEGVIALSEQRTNHNYIGFRRVTEFLLAEGEAPVPYEALATLQPEQFGAVVPVERMESVAERWSALCVGVKFSVIPPVVLALLLLTPKRVTYRNHQVAFIHDRTGYTYLDASGDVLRDLADGTELLAYLNPATPEIIQVVATATGRHLGQLVRLGGTKGAVDIRNKEKLSEAAALTATVFNRAVGELRERHAGEDAELKADREHNDAIIAAHKIETAGLTKAERIGMAAGEVAQQQAQRFSQEKGLQRASDESASLIDEPTPATTSTTRAPAMKPHSVTHLPSEDLL
ncbi:MAG: hypothetical protein H2172_16350 [Opitutus sp.]|nr:hypothetical protein [Opitutus sp.]MCS6275906.1 hypothetical protein [Opitutus sp.]MCS6299793.1 hypothetical protein [Opitutus sp.]